MFAVGTARIEWTVTRGKHVELDFKDVALLITDLEGAHHSIRAPIAPIQEKHFCRHCCLDEVMGFNAHQGPVASKSSLLEVRKQAVMINHLVEDDGLDRAGFFRDA